MPLQRYGLKHTQAGSCMVKQADGDWVDADEAQEVIDRLRRDLRYALREVNAPQPQAREPEIDGNGKQYLFE